MTTAKDYTMICLDKVLRLTGAEYSQTVCVDYCRNDETCKIVVFITIKLHYK